MRETVCLCAELLVGECVMSGCEGDGARRPGGLGFEKLHKAARGNGLLGVVAGDEQVRSLVIGEDVDLA